MIKNKNEKEKGFEKHYRIKETEELLAERHMKAENALRVGTERYWGPPVVFETPIS